MIDFRTIVPPLKSSFAISHGDKCFFVGSCFTENIGKHFINKKFRALVNPFGVLYNPLSIKKSIDILLSHKKIEADKLVHRNGLWNSFTHHSKFSACSQEECLEKINSNISAAADFLQQTSVMLLTFGTARVYLLNETNEVVSNCHQFPSSYFTQKLLSIDEICETYSRLIDKLLHINKTMKFIFTLSPVRHWKDGANENQISKAILMLSIKRLCEQYEQAVYYPAYEIVIDDLRDYRFYAPDMLHPNEVAVSYIWEHFAESFFSKQTKSVCKEVEKIELAVKHRPFNTKNEEFNRFVKQNFDLIAQLEQQYGLEFEEEKKYFSQF